MVIIRGNNKLLLLGSLFFLLVTCPSRTRSAANDVPTNVPERPGQATPASSPLTPPTKELLVQLIERDEDELENRNRDLLDAVQVGMAYSQRLSELDAHLDKVPGLLVARRSKESYHIGPLGYDQEVQARARKALVALKVGETLVERRMSRGAFDKRMTLDYLSQFSLQSTLLRNYCYEQASCVGVDPLIRTADGSCNNLDQPSWGRAKTVYWREVPNAYQDHYQTPRTKSSDGSELPSARRVSFSVSPDVDAPDFEASLMLMQMGQFIAHDMTMAGVTKAPSGSGIGCCAEIYTDFPEFLHPECFAIRLPPDDPYYAQYGEYCMNFVRSAATSRPHCYLGAREQINQLTAYIDGSMIYGNNIQRQQMLRALQGGQMRFQVINDGEYCPFNEDPKETDDCAIAKNSTRKCFFAGDTRANEVAHTTVLQTIFLREHNRIANVLSRMNPRWCDEIIFQQTRRIIVAELQHITYKSMLPHFIGYEYMRRYDLLPRRAGYARTYDPSVDPSVGLAWASATYRFHTVIHGMVKLYSDRGEAGRQNLSDFYNNPERLYDRDGLEMLLRGLLKDSMQSTDRYMSTEITNHLFKVPGKGYGLDLNAIDIQRGRDHGLAGYVVYRKYCGLSTVSSWEEMITVVGAKHVEKLREVYRHVEDVDLVVAGLMEFTLEGSIVGETFACLGAKTFQRVKLGDRFWYENDLEGTAFTPEQLQQIRRVSLARIVCDNSGISRVQPDVFVVPSRTNPQVACNDYGEIPRMNLIYWKEKQ